MIESYRNNKSFKHTQYKYTGRLKKNTKLGKTNLFYKEEKVYDATKRMRRTQSECSGSQFLDYNENDLTIKLESLLSCPQQVLF